MSSGHIINSCVVLHNVCRFNNIEFEEEDYDEPFFEFVPAPRADNHDEGVLVRNRVIEQMFNR